MFTGRCGTSDNAALPHEPCKTCRKRLDSLAKKRNHIVHHGDGNVRVSAEDLKDSLELLTQFSRVLVSGLSDYLES